MAVKATRSAGEKGCRKRLPEKEPSAAWKAGMHRVNLFQDKAKAQDQHDQQAQHTNAAHLFDKEIQTKNQHPT